MHGNQPALLKATMGATPSYELSANANSDPENGWTLIAQLTDGQIQSGHLVINVTNGPLSGGLGTVQFLGAGAAIASQGQLDLTLGKGTVAGSADTVPASMSGTLTGNLVVACWVPASALANAGGTAGGTTSTDGTEALVLDGSLATPQCSAVRAWARQ